MADASVLQIARSAAFLAAADEVKRIAGDLEATECSRKVRSAPCCAVRARQDAKRSTAFT